MGNEIGAILWNCSYIALFMFTFLIVVRAVKCYDEFCKQG